MPSILIGGFREADRRRQLLEKPFAVEARGLDDSRVSLEKRVPFEFRHPVGEELARDVVDMRRSSGLRGSGTPAGHRLPAAASPTNFTERPHPPGVSKDIPGREIERTRDLLGADARVAIDQLAHQ
ncbi:MAG TPA: hypothetical protein VK680_11680 [Solirubrobacteraceae bacterium]|nr:hypothetical protein [Solirubrobacteraceae bacterium]